MKAIFSSFGPCSQGFGRSICFAFRVHNFESFAFTELVFKRHCLLPSQISPSALPFLTNIIFQNLGNPQKSR